MKNIKKVSKVSVVLYLLAIIMLGFATYQVYAYVASIVEQGFVISDSLSDVVSYYMANVTPYVFYASCLGGLGFLIKKVCIFVNTAPMSSQLIEEVTPLVENDEVETAEDVVETQDIMLEQ